MNNRSPAGSVATASFTLTTAIFCLAGTISSEAAASELATLYGSIRPEIIGRFPESGDNVRRMDDGYSRVGVKGRTELSDDLSGFYLYERRVSANDGQDDGAVRAGNDELREVYVGLEGRLGSVSIGRHYGLYYDHIDDELDRHRSHYSDAIVFGDLFVPNSLTYRSPAVAGGSLGLLVEFNDADERGESIDERLELAGTYRAGALALHAGYVSSPLHDGLLGVATSFAFQRVRCAAVFQASKDRDNLVSLAVDVDLDSHHTARLAVTSVTDQTDANVDEVYVVAGADRRFSEHFLAFVEFFRKSTDPVGADDESALVYGFRFDF